MTELVTITEYDYLKSATNPDHSKGEISFLAFDELATKIEASPDDDDLDHGSIFWQRGQQLQARHYVGVIQTSDGTQIEILPKIARHGIDHSISRGIFLKMLREVGDIPNKRGQQADLTAADFPLMEIFLRDFLQDVDQLLKRGLRSDYVRQRDNLPFLKGKLLLNEQIKHNLIRRDRFYVEYDSFEANRPENRLLKSALQKVLKLAKDFANQRLARELLFAFDEIPSSSDYRQDFQACSKDRGMQYYHDSMHWCRLILNDQSPVPQAGEKLFRSFLFPMPRLFEEYVASIFKRYLTGWQVEKQVRSQKLLQWTGTMEKWFDLKPDLILRGNNRVIIVDSKWKLIDTRDRAKHFGIYQADLYQLLTYAKYYGAERVILVYPKTDHFNQPLTFEYIGQNCQLDLWPLDLEAKPKDSTGEFSGFL